MPKGDVLKPDLEDFSWNKIGDIVSLNAENRWSCSLDQRVLDFTLRFEYETFLVEVLFEDVWQLMLPEVFAPSSAFQFVEALVVDIKHEGLEHARVRLFDESTEWRVEAKAVKFRVLA